MGRNFYVLCASYGPVAVGFDGERLYVNPRCTSWTTLERLVNAVPIEKADKRLLYLLSVPRGAVTTYSLYAEAVGVSPRQVGRLMARCTPGAECAALLFGRGDVVEAWRWMRNVLNSPAAFRLDAEEMYKALAEAEGAGRELVAIFHTHPGPPDPSPLDVRYMFLGEAFIIAAIGVAIGSVLLVPLSDIDLSTLFNAGPDMSFLPPGTRLIIDPTAVAAAVMVTLGGATYNAKTVYGVVGNNAARLTIYTGDAIR